MFRPSRVQARVVFSREGERKYVTHALTEDRWALWHEYMCKGAVVYVCGTINAANDVRETILGVIKEVGRPGWTEKTVVCLRRALAAKQTFFSFQAQKFGTAFRMYRTLLGGCASTPLKTWFQN